LGAQWRRSGDAELAMARSIETCRETTQARWQGGRRLGWHAQGRGCIRDRGKVHEEEMKQRRAAVRPGRRELWREAAVGKRNMARGNEPTSRSRRSAERGGAAGRSDRWEHRRESKIERGTPPARGMGIGNDCEKNFRVGRKIARGWLQDYKRLRFAGLYVLCFQ
jgi:hypothetical protein